MGSAAEGLISILCCESRGPSPGAPQPRSEEWLRERGGEGRDGREVAEGQTGDAESQGRQLHKDKHAAEGGERGRGRSWRI